MRRTALSRAVESAAVKAKVAADAQADALSKAARAAAKLKRAKQRILEPSMAEYWHSSRKWKPVYVLGDTAESDEESGGGGGGGGGLLLHIQRRLLGKSADDQTLSAESVSGCTLHNSSSDDADRSDADPDHVVLITTTRGKNDVVKLRFGTPGRARSVLNTLRREWNCGECETTISSSEVASKQAALKANLEEAGVSSSGGDAAPTTPSPKTSLKASPKASPTPRRRKPNERVFGVRQFFKAMISGRRTLYGNVIVDLATTFDAIDTSGNHFLRRDEFKRALVRLDISLGHRQMDALMDHLDATGDETVSYDKFCDAFRWMAGYGGGDGSGGGGRGAAKVPRGYTERVEGKETTLGRRLSSLTSSGASVSATANANASAVGRGSAPALNFPRSAMSPQPRAKKPAAVSGSSRTAPKVLSARQERQRALLAEQRRRTSLLVNQISVTRHQPAAMRQLSVAAAAASASAAGASAGAGSAAAVSPWYSKRRSGPEGGRRGGGGGGGRRTAQQRSTASRSTAARTMASERRGRRGSGSGSTRAPPPAAAASSSTAGRRRGSGSQISLSAWAETANGAALALSQAATQHRRTGRR